MKIVNVSGRAGVLTEMDTVVDVQTASGGRFGPEPMEVFSQWNDFWEWSRTAAFTSTPGVPLDKGALGPPVPRPRQVFAVALNYRSHAAESKLGPQPILSIFTKFPACISGPYADIPLPKRTVDWEVELVAVVGRPAYRVNAEEAWDYLAGLTLGQDISERESQLMGSAPQFSLAKSYLGFGPTGPSLVTLDEFPDRAAVSLGCSVNGHQMQKGSTRDMIFPIPEIVSRLSHVLTLYPGDLIFTGTPSGVGHRREPPRFLGSGDVLVSDAEIIGEMRNNCVTAD